MKTGTKDTLRIIAYILLLVAAIIGISQLPSSKRQQQYLRWELFSEDSVLTLKKSTTHD